MPSCVGVGRWVVRVPESRSLKTKRSVIRGLRDRMRARFKASVAETDFQDELQRAELTASVAASEYRLAEDVLARLDDLVCSDPRIFVLQRNLDVMRIGV
jgi:uncharacterized protein YlxP (DUF503 family)